MLETEREQEKPYEEVVADFLAAGQRFVESYRQGMERAMAEFVRVTAEQQRARRSPEQRKVNA